MIEIDNEFMPDIQPSANKFKVVRLADIVNMNVALALTDIVALFSESTFFVIPVLDVHTRRDKRYKRRLTPNASRRPSSPCYPYP